MRRGSQRGERVPLLILLVFLALILTLGAAVIVLGFDRGPDLVPRPRTAGRAAPVTELPAVPPPAVALSWLEQGFHVPECRPATRAEPTIEEGAECTASPRIRLCLDPGEALHNGLDVAALDFDAVLEQAEEVIGRPRERQLTILWHSEATWGALVARERIPGGVVGFYDGAVHLSPYPGVQVVRHEIWHAVLSEEVRCAPVSVHEGLASWFANDVRVEALADAVVNGFWTPERLDLAFQSPSLEEVDRAYAQAGARTMAAVRHDGVEAVARWTEWLRDRDRSSPVEAWDALDRATDAALRDDAVRLLFDLDPLDDPSALRSLIHAPSDIVCQPSSPQGSLYRLGPEAYDLHCELVGDSEVRH